MASKKFLGIDTSNYKTSVALCDMEGNIVGDERKLLKVKEGERGLRQSDALFQHVENLPVLLKKLFEGADSGEVAGICVSSKPRPVEGSYMPCFNAGLPTAGSLAAALKVPLWLTSHQEGHIAAAGAGRKEEFLPDHFLAFHLSGGTCELLDVSGAITNIGGSLDISFGQLLDRTGVALGMAFPAGEEMDRIALEASKSDFKRVLTRVKVSDSSFNLSGIETQVLRKTAELLAGGKDKGSAEAANLITEVFEKIAETASSAVFQAFEKTGADTALLVGGVSSSAFLRERLQKLFGEKRKNLIFGEPAYSSDNAAGVALIGREHYLMEKING